MKHSEDILARLSGKRIFSKVDLLKAFYHIPIAERDIHETTVITPLGWFESGEMTFGLRNAAQSFQCFLHEVLRDLDFCVSYVDDILVSSESPEQHEQHLRILFAFDECVF